MKLRNRCRLEIERLEDRCVPTVTAKVIGGVLVVRGTPDGAVEILRDNGAGTFDVIDDGTTVLNNAAGVTSILVKLGSTNDTVTIDLDGGTLNRGVTAFLGNGTNSLTVQNGTIGGSLLAYGGRGADSVALADLTVTGNTYVALDGGADELTTDTATLSGDLTTVGINTITLDAASSVGDDATFFGDSSGSTITVGAEVAGDVRFIASLFFSTGSNDVTIDAEVGGDVVFTSSLFNQAGHSLTINANVGDDVTFLGGSRDDTLAVGDVTIGGSLNAVTGGGDDTVTLEAVSINDDSLISLGFGNDTFEIDSGANLNGNTLRVFGGFGTDTRTADPLPTGVLVFGFEDTI